MKKLSLIFGLALGMLAVGCSQDAGVEDNAPVGDTPEVNVVTLGVSLDDEVQPEVRTSLGELAGDKHVVLWSAGDKVAVNGKESSAVADEYVGASAAAFEVAGVKAPYSVFYPAGALNANGQLSLATTQAYKVGSFADGVAVMAGYSESESVNLKHLLSFVKLTIAQGEETASEFSSISVTSLSGRAISGLFNVDYENAELSPVAGEGKDCVTVSNVALVDGKAVVYVGVPSGKYVDGFEVKVVGSTSVMTRTAYTSTGLNLVPGYLVSMPEIAFAGSVVDEIVVKNGQDLWNLCANTLTEGNTFKGTIKFANDIDMSNIDLDGITAYLNEGATLDGQGYAIKNWTSTQGIIYDNYGTVKNIVLDKSCKFSYPLNTDVKMCGFVVMCNLGTVSGCVNNADITFNDPSCDFNFNRFLGSIVGTISHGVTGATTAGDPDKVGEGYDRPEARVENCINNGNITITANSYNNDGTTGGWMYIGGVAGAYIQHYTESTGGLYNCVNNGTVVVNIPMIYKNLIMIGGIVGSAGKVYNGAGNNPILAYCHVENCVNNGDVTFEGCAQGNKFYMAGVAGVSHAAMDSCVNNGEVKLVGNTDTINSEAFMGGITSIFSGNITDCHNKKSVKVDYINSGYTVYVGGIAGKNITYYSSNTKYNTNTILDCTNSGDVDVRYYSTADKVNGVGGILGAGHNGCGIVEVTNCENSGAVTVEVLSGSTATSRPEVGGIAGDIQVKVDMAKFTGCVNRGAVSLIHNGTASNKAKDSSVGGIVGTDYASFSNCQSLGAVSISGDGLNGASGPAMISPIGSRLGNWGAKFDGCVIDCAVTYPADANVCFGLFQADSWSQKTVSVGATKANVVKSTTTINGVAVTADFVAELSNILGRNQKGGEFVVAEGGIVLE